MELRQTQEGNWKLTVKHSTPGVVIQDAFLTFSHDGVEESMDPFDITTSEKTLETGWYTDLGTDIPQEQIIKYPPEGERFTYNDKKYIVHWSLTTNPYNDSGITPTLSLEALDSTVVSALGGTVRIRVSCNTAWTISTSSAWATLSSTSGNGNSTVTVTVKSYTGTSSDRNVTITAHAASLTDSVTITQRKAEQTAILDMYPDIDRVAASGGTVVLTINSNTAWTLTKDSSWATLSKTAGTRNDSVTLTIPEFSSTKADRSVTVTASANGAQSVSATVYQSKLDPSQVATYEFSISANPTTIEWNGSSWLTGEFITKLGGIETSRVAVSPSQVLWTITKNSAFTEPITSEGELVARNDTIYNNREVKVKGTYNGIESNEVSIMVNKKPNLEPWYELKVIPYYAELSSAGTTSLTAQFLTYLNGDTEPTTIEDVTSSATWESNKTQVAMVSGGSVTANNETYTEQLVTIKATYGGYYGNASIVVAPREGEEPTYYYALVVTPTAATLGWNETVQLEAKLYMYASGNPTPIDISTVTSACDWTTSEAYIGVSNVAMSRGMVQSYNYTDTDKTGIITATYQSAYSATAVITALARDIDINVDTSNVTIDCSDDYSFTKQIVAEDDVTWHVAAVDVESTGAPVEWLTISPVNGSGNGQFTVTINSDNTGKYHRDCFIRVFYPADSTIFKQFEVTQNPTPKFVVQERTINAPTLGSTEEIPVITNYHLTLSNNGNSWITVTEAETANGYKAVIKTSEASAQRTGTVTIGSEYSGSCTSFTPVNITVNQEYTPPVPPSGNDKVFIYETESSERKDELTFNRSAAAQIVEFYISTNANCHVVSTGCTPQSSSAHCGQIRITETNDYDLTTGATIVPTGLDGKRKLLVHIPMNQYTGYGMARTFNIRIETTAYTSSDLNYDDHVEITINQAYNDYYDSGYTMMFLVENQELGQDEVSINSSSRTVRPFVDINATRIYTAGYSGESKIYDYIDNSGIDDQRMHLTVSEPSVVIATDVGHGGSYVPSTERPYELYFPANETFDTTGSTKNIVLTLSYTGASGSVSKTVTVHQAWGPKPLVEVSAHLLSGSPAAYVGSASATVVGNSAISIQPNSTTVYVSCEANTVLAVSGEYGRFTVGGDMQYGVGYDVGDQSGKAISLTNVAPSGSHYSIVINCSKQGKATKQLLIDVTVQ